MTSLIWSVKDPYKTVTPAIFKSAEIGQTFFFPLRWPSEQEDWISVKFGFSMLWIQMSTASGGSGWCHVWLCMSEQGLGWLIRAEGCRGGLNGRCLESSGAFHISAVSKLFWCFVWLTLMFSLCVTDSASLSCINPLTPTSLLLWIARLLPKNLACFRGLMENL